MDFIFNLIAWVMFAALIASIITLIYVVIRAIIIAVHTKREEERKRKELAFAAINELYKRRSF